MEIKKINGREIKIDKIEDRKYKINFDNVEAIIKEITFGERNDIIDKVTKYSKITEDYYIDSIEFNNELLKNSIIELKVNDKQVDIDSTDADIIEIILELLVSKIKELENIKVNDNLIVKENTYILEKDEIYAEIKKWTWGEKNRVIQSASVYDPIADDLRILNGRVSELLLLNTLRKLVIDGKEYDITIENIRNLPLKIGDLLSQASLKINTLGSIEKKK